MSYSLNAYEQVLEGTPGGETVIMPTGPYPFDSQGKVKPEYNLEAILRAARLRIFESAGEPGQVISASRIQALANEDWASLKAQFNDTEDGRIQWRTVAGTLLYEGSPNSFSWDSGSLEAFTSELFSIVVSILQASSAAHSTVSREITAYLQQGTSPPRDVLIGLAAYSEDWARFEASASNAVGDYNDFHKLVMIDLNYLASSANSLAQLLGESYETELTRMRERIAAQTRLIEQLVAEKKKLRERIAQLEGESWFKAMQDMLKNAKLPQIKLPGAEIEKYIKYGLYGLGGLIILKVMAFLR